MNPFFYPNRWVKNDGSSSIQLSAVFIRCQDNIAIPAFKIGMQRFFPVSDVA